MSLTMGRNDMCTGFEIAALATAAVGVGSSSYSAHKQRSATRKAQREQEKLIAEQKAQALEERKNKIDALRKSGGVGLIAGRRTLVSGSETGLGATGGMTANTGLNTKLG